MNNEHLIKLVSYLERVYRIVPDSEGDLQREGLKLLRSLTAVY